MAPVGLKACVRGCGEVQPGMYDAPGYLAHWKQSGKLWNVHHDVHIKTTAHLCKSSYILGLCPLDATHHRYPIQTSGPLLRKVSPPPPDPLLLYHTQRSVWASQWASAPLICEHVEGRSSYSTIKNICLRRRTQKSPTLPASWDQSWLQLGVPLYKWCQ